MPDTFFRNEKDAKFHDIIQPNLYVRVFPNGDVLYSIRVNRIKISNLIIARFRSFVRPFVRSSVTLSLRKQ